MRVGERAAIPGCLDKVLQLRFNAQDKKSVLDTIEALIQDAVYFGDGGDGRLRAAHGGRRERKAAAPMASLWIGGVVAGLLGTTV